jgi:UDP-N-acetylglucosamine 2-epimerase (non-hydrolysing)
MKNCKSPRILIVFGTRPELIKLAPVIQQFHQQELSAEILIVNAAQHEDLVNDQLNFWNIEPDITLTRKENKRSMGKMQAETMEQLQDVLEEYPSLEYLIVQGDTNTTWASANLAFLNQIKILHVEAGLRTYDLNSPFPEEFNRICISKIAYHHFAPSKLTSQNLINEGIDKEKITICGNTVIDALIQSIKKDERNGYEKDEVIITLHRRENVHHFNALLKIVENLTNLFPSLKFRWITHPNYKPEHQEQLTRISGNIIVLEHLPYAEFIQLYSKARFIITDSGGVTEEASQLGIPVVVYREKTERIEPLTNGYSMIVSLNQIEIEHFFLKNIDHLRTPNKYFGNGNTSELILDWIKKELNYIEVNTAIIGGGPAGTGTILKSMKDGTFDDYMAGGVAIIEKTSSLVAGSLTGYKVNSDTLSDVFLECLEGWTAEYLELDQLHPEIEFIKTYSGKPIPLYKLKSFFNKLSILLTNALLKTSTCHLLLNSKATFIKKRKTGDYLITLNTGKKIICKNIIMATGASPKISIEQITDIDLKLSMYTDKTFTSDSIIKGFLDDKTDELKNKDPQIVILGGSHSAFSAADYLLKRLDLQKGKISIWGNTAPKIFYPNKEKAIAEGYNDFTIEDICPVTKRLYRLAGLRMDGRDLYRRMLGLDPNIETRVCFNLIHNDHRKLKEHLHHADIIINAFGYEFDAISLFDEHNGSIIYVGSKTGYWVNSKCEMLDDNKKKIENIFATGLATGFIPGGSLGGEASFKGQTNGIWYYQNIIAEIILQRILSNYYVDHINKNLIPAIR